jgi:hypothetical protein
MEFNHFTFHCAPLLILKPRNNLTCHLIRFPLVVLTIITGSVDEAKTELNVINALIIPGLSYFPE